jgi:hypothetical protein
MAVLRDDKIEGCLSGRRLTGARRAASSFVAGFIDGFGGVMPIESKRPRRTYSGRSLTGDWAAVGGSIRQVTSEDIEQRIRYLDKKLGKVGGIELKREQMRLHNLCRTSELGACGTQEVATSVSRGSRAHE